MRPITVLYDIYQSVGFSNLTFRSAHNA